MDKQLSKLVGSRTTAANNARGANIRRALKGWAGVDGLASLAGLLNRGAAYEMFVERKVYTASLCVFQFVRRTGESERPDGSERQFGVGIFSEMGN